MKTAQSGVRFIQEMQRIIDRNEINHGILRLREQVKRLTGHLSTQEADAILANVKALLCEVENAHERRGDAA